MKVQYQKKSKDETLIVRLRPPGLSCGLRDNRLPFSNNGRNNEPSLDLMKRVIRS